MLIGIAALTGISFSYALGNVVPLTGSKGLGLPSANTWLPPGAASLAINLILCLAISLIIVFLNKRFNLTHSTSVLIAGLFLLIQAATPSVTGQFYGGTLLCLVVVSCAALLFEAYHNPEATRAVFIIFFFLALGSLTQYAYVMYIPVFMIGCAQMRILTGKSLTAAILGIMTPPWILAGFGVIGIDDFTLPEFSNIFAALHNRELLHITATIGCTLVLCTVGAAGCMLRTYSYNTRGRAFNGFIYIVSIATIALVFVDYTNVASYIPMLNCCAAYHTAHFFSIHSRRHSYIGILTVIAVYVGLYIWSILL